MSSTDPRADAYHRHIFGCRDCYAPKARYCDEGFRLWAEYSAPAWAGMIVKLRSVHERRSMLENRDPRLRPLIEEEVKRLWRERQAEQDRDR